ncbi:Transposon Ty3-G Gag-Pol polyprotein [Nosema granulosis]|uniref:Transposon Ty3-G Gag-Pol polyprotein n=1 Tax=Nosema granulosis TaxID=83296 RepID=A0A9P6GYX5_9MICR|nr:Transposon Ty3-G Gag-Pol polyprotein [Nosema granulosis]
MKDPMRLYTCLLEEFVFEEELDLKIELNTVKYRENFVVILGRGWIKNKNMDHRSHISLTTEEALTRLSMAKREGHEGLTCEINTKPGFRVVDVPYRIPQSLETKIYEEIARLLSKGYIRESRSSWLNNVRPVVKKDGSVRLTTNLIKLNDFVDLDSYSLPRME